MQPSDIYNQNLADLPDRIVCGFDDPAGRIRCHDALQPCQNSVFSWTEMRQSIEDLNSGPKAVMCPTMYMPIKNATTMNVGDKNLTIMAEGQQFGTYGGVVKQEFLPCAGRKNRYLRGCSLTRYTDNLTKARCYMGKLKNDVTGRIGNTIDRNRNNYGVGETSGCPRNWQDPNARDMFMDKYCNNFNGVLGINQLCDEWWNLRDQDSIRDQRAVNLCKGSKHPKCACINAKKPSSDSTIPASLYWVFDATCGDPTKQSYRTKGMRNLNFMNCQQSLDINRVSGGSNVTNNTMNQACVMRIYNQSMGLPPPPEIPPPRNNPSVVTSAPPPPPSGLSGSIQTPPFNPDSGIGPSNDIVNNSGGNATFSTTTPPPTTTLFDMLREDSNDPPPINSGGSITSIITPNVASNSSSNTNNDPGLVGMGSGTGQSSSVGDISINSGNNFNENVGNPFATHFDVAVIPDIPPPSNNPLVNTPLPQNNNQNSSANDIVNDPRPSFNNPNSAPSSNDMASAFDSMVIPPQSAPSSSNSSSNVVTDIPLQKSDLNLNTRAETNQTAPADKKESNSSFMMFFVVMIFLIIFAIMFRGVLSRRSANRSTFAEPAQEV